ncbi:MAG: thiamine pyrophosphate-binding protein [Nitrososphaeria archaeon]|nr:thiamine pyrophosphate-binding protein [Nitrososphaeria archaeon]NIN52041.1 thiamine pyrophosphate-binding protein [Nitrososphaeria archaeon]NIQ32502.1 thiamine pyrophosphate-binding protein [Nitrososphaeria archaeon]
MRGAVSLIRTLLEYNVEYIFGLPGDTSVSFYDALLDAQPEMKHVMARDERSASFMADAYARVSFKPGVCEGPSGGGATYIIPGVAEAYRSSIPLIVLTTDIPLHYVNKGMLTELDQVRLFRSITKGSFQITHAGNISETVRRAFRIATMGKPGPVHLSLPKNVLDEDAQVEIYGEEECRRYPSHREHPDVGEVEKAADLLLAAERPVIVAGGGVIISQAWEELIILAELTGVLVATTITGKGSIPENHPLSIGVVGENGGRPYANKLVKEADLVFFIGCKTGSVATRKWTLPPAGIKIVHSDVDPEVIGNNYPTEVGIKGDAKLVLHELLKYLERKLEKGMFKGEERLEEIGKLAREWREEFISKSRSDSVPIKPQRIIRELREALPREAILVVDAGTGTPFASAYFDVLSPGRRFVCFRSFGALGTAVPGSIGAKMAAPGKTVMGLSGDGGFTFSVGELETARRVGTDFTILVFNNGCFGWIKALQHLYHEARYMSVDFLDVDYSRVAEAFGCRGIRVERPSEIREALHIALKSGEPTVVDIVSEPLHSELPPVSPWIEKSTSRS